MRCAVKPWRRVGTSLCPTWRRPQKNTPTALHDTSLARARCPQTQPALRLLYMIRSSTPSSVIFWPESFWNRRVASPASRCSATPARRRRTVRDPTRQIQSGDSPGERSGPGGKKREDGWAARREGCYTRRLLAVLATGPGHTGGRTGEGKSCEEDSYRRLLCWRWRRH